MARAVAVLCAVLFSLVGVAECNDFVEPADRELARKAAAKAVSDCKGYDSMGLTAADRADIKEDLLAASADNILLQVLEEASQTQSDIAPVLLTRISDPGFLVPQLGSLIAGLVFLTFYLTCCCWTCCPFCGCLRCCKQKRSVSKFVKICFLVALACIVVALIVGASLAVRGYRSASMGFEVTLCEAAKMVNSTMSGQQNPEFFGLIPTLEVFQGLKDSLDSNSDFISEVRSVVSSTQKISDAVVLASGTLKLLRDMMAASNNKLPVNVLGEDLLHECALCPELESALNPAIETLDGSTGKALDSAREEIDKQLSGDSLTSLQGSMDSASKPLMQLKESMHTAFGPFVETTTMKTVSESTNSYGVMSSVFAVLFALTLASCGGFSVITWLLCEKRKRDDDVEIYRPHTHRCACISWCGACYYAIYALIIGGIMTVVAVPLSSMCLIMEDVNKDMLNDISGALNLDMDGDGGEMLADMIGTCFRNPDPDANPKLLDLIFIREDNGDKVTMDDKIVGQTKEKIDEQFKKITSSMGDSNGAPKLNDEPDIVKLKNTLKDTKISAMMFPRSEDIASAQHAATYGAMANDATLKPYMASSADCDDFVIPAGMPEEGTNVLGVQSFTDALSSYGASIVLGTCAKKVVCQDAVATPRGMACEAANKFMELKQDLLSSNTFTCYRFKTSLGTPCDVKNMRESPAGSGNFQNDCLWNGKVMSEAYECTLDELTTLVSEFDVRLDKVFARLDGATSIVMSDIDVRLKDAVDTHIISPITAVATGLTCGFLGKTYQGVLDGMCYGGVFGFRAMASSYVFCGVVTLFLAILMYIVWRIALDNVNSEVEV